MSEAKQDSIDHGAKLAELIGKQSADYDKLHYSYVEVRGKNMDLEEELAESTRRETKLRLEARNTQRLNRDHAIRLERIIEQERGDKVDAQNENARLLVQIDKLNETVKQKHVEQASVVLQMIMSESVRQFGNVVQAVSHMFVNRRKSKADAAMQSTLLMDYVTKQPSLYRTVAQYYNSINLPVPTAAALKLQMIEHVKQNAHLYLKDPDIQAYREALIIMVTQPTSQVNRSRVMTSVRDGFDYINVFDAGFDVAILSDNTSWAATLSDSLLDISGHLISANF
ncbi:hypothetical protein HOS33_gp321 [Erwinia phage vB_EamM_Y3]|uniref:Uncharacterized protein n=1 Tax=Erwinia phage vB_EamM_Y3 TaxID=1983553 RepID=A0A2H4IBM7_9CAUD|nr:hypothetical protein HOS33_gp321 [Erwinia phage vB_EamM_Y3]ARW58961.1 hypothetical protein Y3_321 [Erwinia phage vB_EamM_Y3]